MDRGRILFTGDLHLAEAASAEYRWEVFKRLRRRCIAEQIDHLVILGDLTHEKDGHRSLFVNRVRDELRHLSEVAPIHIVEGNHDRVHAGAPAFFRFLDAEPRITWYCTARKARLAGWKMLMLPHGSNRLQATNTSAADAKAKRYTERLRAAARASDWVLAHEPVRGAQLSSQGFVLKDDPRKPSLNLREHWTVSGDVHVPQKLGKLLYVGAPHPINFGDDWQCRFLLLAEDGKMRACPIAAPRKMHIDLGPEDFTLPDEVASSDVLRIVATHHPSALSEWGTIREALYAEAHRRGAQIASYQSVPVRSAIEAAAKFAPADNAQETFDRFCTERSITGTERAAGKTLLESVL